jgi:hypothetical protein
LGLAGAQRKAVFLNRLPLITTRAMTGDGGMSNWISLHDLLNRWDIEKFEVIEYLKKGLQPYTKVSGRPLYCPSFCHLGPINEGIIKTSLETIELYGPELNKYQKLLVAWGEKAEEELKAIKKDDPDFVSWKWIAALSDDDYKKLFTELDGAIFKEEDVLEFESTLDHGISKAPDRKNAHMENYFHLSGDYWEIGYKGKDTKLRNLERLRYIIHLLDNPDKEIYSHDLVQLVKGERPEVNNEIAKMGKERLENEEGLNLEDIYIKDLSAEEKDGLEDTIFKMWANYKQSIGVTTEKGHEKKWKSAKRHLLNEYGITIYENEKGLKFYYRPRLSPDKEKSRVNVSQNISNAIRDIEDKLPLLGKHLQKQINKGAKCIYHVDAADPIKWDILHVKKR